MMLQTNEPAQEPKTGDPCEDHIQTDTCGVHLSCLHTK